MSQKTPIDLGDVEYELPKRSLKKSWQEDILREFIDEFRPEGLEYAVYVLECSSPNRRNEIEDPHDGRKIKVDQALAHDRLFYVGWTKNIVQRICQHNRGLSKAAKFTQQYPPINIQEIRWYESERIARQKESDVAKEYENQTREAVRSIDCNSVSPSMEYLELVQRSESETWYVYCIPNRFE